MKKKALWITQTAAMLALLITLQWATRSLGQIATGSCVNAVLAVTVLFCGMGSGLAVALCSPVFAWLFGIAPQLVTVPAIMAGNAVFITVLWLFIGKQQNPWRKLAAWLCAAASKFAVLHVLVVRVICGLASGVLLDMQVLKTPMLEKLPAMFTWPQLVTALIGGGAALLMVPVLKKARQTI